MKKAQKASTSVQINIVDITGKVVDTAELSPEIFSAKVSDVLLAQAVRVHLARERSGTRSTKTRSMVTGSTKKIFRQKGTGNARHGSRKAPIFVGGGVAHGPKPQDFTLEMSKTMRKKALYGALTKHVQAQGMVVVRGLSDVAPKTKEMHAVLRSVCPSGEHVTKKDTSTLIVLAPEMASVRQAAKNLSYVDMLPVSQLNAYDVLCHQRIVFAEQALAAMNSGEQI